MITRRKFIVSFGVGALATSLASLAQQQSKVWRIGFLGTASASGYVREMDAIRAALRDLGYMEGRNIVIEYRWAESNPERLRKMAAELVALKVDVIITHSISGTRTAGEATKSIPIVIADSADPVAAGLVASHARPGGNITGSTSFQTEIHAKRLELLKQAVPRLKRVAVLFNALTPPIAVFFREMEAAARRMNLELHEHKVRGPADFPGAFVAMAKMRAEAAVIGEDPMLNSNGKAIAALAVTYRLPAIGFTNFADDGGLLGYGANRPLVFGRAASFVDKILKGAKPGELPIERATKFELIVNLKTAERLGLRLPPQLLQRTDRVIE